MPKGLPPYDDYNVYKVFHAAENRYMAILVNSQRRTSTSYARYVMACHLGRKLEEFEQVDHIDNDPSNDDPSNLQLLSATDNRLKHSSTLVTAWCRTTCPVCGTPIERRWKQTHVAKKSGKYTTCSRRCGSRTVNLDVEQVLVKFSRPSVEVTPL